MRIGHVVSSLRTGGAEIMLLRYVEAADHAPFVFYLGGERDLESDFEAAGATVIELDIDSILDLPALNAVRSRFASYDFDILHAHLPSPMLVARLAGRAAKVDTIVSTHHNVNYPSTLRTAERATRCLDTHHVAVSESVRDTHAFRFDRADWSVIYNGIDVDAFERQVRESTVPEGFDGDGPVFLNVGQYVPQKGQRYLIEAMGHLVGRIPGAQAILVGYGPLEAELHTTIREVGVEDAVTVTGKVPDIHEYYAAADVFVFSSLFEGLPITGLEAMAAGLPIVGTRVPGISEVVEEGTTGVLVPPESPTALADAMHTVATNAPEAMGERASRRVRDRFSIEQMVAAHDQLYEQLAGYD